MENKMLRQVLFSLNEDWKKEKQNLWERLEREGILCANFEEAGWPVRKWNEATVVLTDSPQTGTELAREGIICFGCCHVQNERENQKPAMELTGADANTNVSSGWFDGAALVLEGFEEIDAEYLEEWMLRAKGMPAAIARTNRLLIREIADEDIPELEQIGRECGEAEAHEETNERILYAGENVCEEKKMYVQGSRFTKEYLYSYRRTAYRLQGFGLWSVLYQGKVIGCCGFEPWDEKLETAESAAQRIVPGKRKVDTIQSPAGMSPDRTDKILQYHRTFREASAILPGIILEMQYMLNAAYHRQGFGTEMCRAVLAYARERLDVDEVRLRIRKSNLASRALAKKLGFVPVAGSVET